MSSYNYFKYRLGFKKFKPGVLVKICLPLPGQLSYDFPVHGEYDSELDGPTFSVDHGQIGMLVMHAKRGRNMSDVYLFGDKLVPMARGYVEKYNGE